MSVEVDSELTEISRRVRAWREQEGLTLQELASRSGVATSTIQKVEKEQMIPSVAVIVKIARGLGRRTSELVEEGEDRLDLVCLRAGDRTRIGVADRLVVERLTGDVFEPSFEMWRVTLHPGVSSGGPIAYAGEELVLCESGVLTVQVAERDHELEPGDTLHFKATVPHAWRNRGDAPVVFSVTGTLSHKLRAALHERAVSAATNPSPVREP
jgi:transcriptional regulator with XRE-family HTH domain